MRPFWITFYSYKGGVGRSLALANTAALMVQRGRGVVLIDFDLEAPGLDSFDEFKSVAGKPGVVEYVTEFEQKQKAPDITQFIHRCELPGKLRGKLWIMPAGRKDGTYNVCRQNLDWARLYESGLGEPFVENWKSAITRHCQPDYVLVDSRTGLTDVGGICTLHLPDLVVMLFGLNEQNVRGVAAVAKTIRESKITRLPQIHYVASPVPNLSREEKSPFALRWTAAASQLGVKIESTIRYHPLAALSEKLFSIDPGFRQSTIAEDYRDIFGQLIAYNRSGFDFLQSQAHEAIAASDTSLMERLITVMEQEFPDRPESLMARAQLKKALGDPQSADALAGLALQAEPHYENALTWLIASAKRRRDFKTALDLSKSAIRRAAELPPARVYDLSVELGNLAMAAGEPLIARAAFEAALAYVKQKKKEGDPDPIGTMAHNFNLAESRRRCADVPDARTWRTIVSLFEASGATEAPLVYQANRWQAMHIPFAMLGEKAKAREALEKARHAAELLGPVEDIFTVKTYTEASVPEFLKINDDMLRALGTGQLWDGMPIPATPVPPDESESSAPSDTDILRSPPRAFDLDE